MFNQALGGGAERPSTVRRPVRTMTFKGEEPPASKPLFPKTAPKLIPNSSWERDPFIEEGEKALERTGVPKADKPEPLPKGWWHRSRYLMLWAVVALGGLTSTRAITHSPEVDLSAHDPQIVEMYQDRNNRGTNPENLRKILEMEKQGSLDLFFPNLDLEARATALQHAEETIGKLDAVSSDIDSQLMPSAIQFVAGLFMIIFFGASILFRTTSCLEPEDNSKEVLLRAMGLPRRLLTRLFKEQIEIRPLSEAETQQMQRSLEMTSSILQESLDELHLTMEKHPTIQEKLTQVLAADGDKAPLALLMEILLDQTLDKLLKGDALPKERFSKTKSLSFLDVAEQLEYLLVKHQAEGTLFTPLLTREPEHPKKEILAHTLSMTILGERLATIEQSLRELTQRIQALTNKKGLSADTERVFLQTEKEDLLSQRRPLKALYQQRQQQVKSALAHHQNKGSLNSPEDTLVGMPLSEELRLQMKADTLMQRMQDDQPNNDPPSVL